jgi:4-hydroxy 2-oxovalerate aldolase
MSTDVFFNPIWDVRMTDTSLRDGSHHKRHQFTKDEVGAIVAALDAAGVPVIEVTHGDGLGGSSFNYGFSKTPEQELIKLAAETAKEARIAFLMLPGVGTKEDIKEAQDNGGSICRIATHCTEADVSIQHFGLARELGLETVGFLMMSHTIPPEKLAQQARIMADAGCQCVYVVDSAGALVLEGVRDRVAALVAELGSAAQVGFHGHENLGLGVANSVEAVRAGAKQIDGSCRRFGAGAGNAPVEALIGVFDKIGVKTGIDFFDIADAGRMRAGPQRADHGVFRRLLQLPQARRASVRALRGARGGAAAPGRSAQTHRWPGRPIDRYRFGDQARTGQRRGRQALRTPLVADGVAAAPGRFTIPQVRAAA